MFYNQQNNKIMKKTILYYAFAAFIISCGSKKVTPEIFLIPFNYHGTVKVIFNESCGQKETFDGKKRMYIIPENGILITQFKQEFGIINQEYYYVDAKGSRTLIPKMMLQDFNEATTTERNEHEPSRNQVAIFQWGNTGTAQLTGEKKYDFYMFHVGTYTEVRDSFTTLFEGEGGYGYNYEHRFDSVEHVQIKACRGK